MGARSQPAPAAIPQPRSTNPIPGGDPFNAPAERRDVAADTLSGRSPLGGSSWPELDARIAELETLIAADEETIKEMISAPPSDAYDQLIHSPELRQVAARLPLLQGELDELRRWREQPRDR